MVARLPRHGNAVSQILDYEHSGPTVLVSDQDNSASEVGDLGGGGASTTSSNGDNTSGSRATGSGGADSSNDRVCLGALWVEGETDNQPCPLRETSPLVDPLADGALLFEALRAGVQRGSVQAMFDKLTAVSPSEISQLASGVTHIRFRLCLYHCSYLYKGVPLDFQSDISFYKIYAYEQKRPPL